MLSLSQVHCDGGSSHILWNVCLLVVVTGMMGFVKGTYIKRVSMILQWCSENEIYLNLLLFVDSYYYNDYHKNSDLTTDSILVYFESFYFYTCVCIYI